MHKGLVAYAGGSALLLMCLVGVASPGSAQGGGGIAAAPSQFPAVNYACLAFQLPEDDDEAVTAMDRARAEWQIAARAAKLRSSTPLFVDASLETMSVGTNAVSVPALICAIVPSGTKVPGLMVKDVPRRDGIAGYCSDGKLSSCLESAAPTAGYSEKSPLLLLPIFAAWPQSKAAPATVQEIVGYLATNFIDAGEDFAGEGKTFEQGTGGLAPLIQCAAEGCPQPPGPHSVDVVGNGTAWFLPSPP